MKGSTCRGAIKSTLLAGLVAVVPAIFTIYILIVFIQFLESSTKSVLLTVIEEHQYIPGVGIVIFIAVLFIAGSLLKMASMNYIYTIVEKRIQQVPLAKSIYSGVKDMMGVLSDTTELNQPVLLTLPGDYGSVVGFITNKRPVDSIPALTEEQVAVYIPMSYQMGGFTVYTSSENLCMIDADKEDVLRFVLTAGMRKQEAEKVD